MLRSLLLTIFILFASFVASASPVIFTPSLTIIPKLHTVRGACLKGPVPRTSSCKPNTVVAVPAGRHGLLCDLAVDVFATVAMQDADNKIKRKYLKARRGHHYLHCVQRLSGTGQPDGPGYVMLCMQSYSSWSANPNHRYTCN